jgi:hypothetical protein
VGATGRGDALRSASVTILLPMIGYLAMTFG